MQASPLYSNALYYEWTSPANDITIRLSLEVVSRLGAVVLEGFRALRTRGLEVGGLLLGKFAPGQERITIIEDFEPIDSEHRSGPSYTLSTKDKELLESRLAAHAREQGLSVVGYWRSHTRPGLCLNQEDYANIRTYFADPAQVFLVVRPSAAEPSVGGFCFWEDGEVRGECSYQVFPFDAERLLVGEFRILDAADPCQLGDRDSVPSAGAHDPPATAGPAPAVVLAQAAPEPAERQAGIRPRYWISLALAAVLTSLLALTAPVIYRVGRSTGAQPIMPSEPSTATELSLKVSRETDHGLRLGWDRDSTAVRGAVVGVLFITDGNRLVRLDLDKKLLSEGSIVYFPSGGDVEFRLAVSANGRGINESVRALMPISAPPKPPVPGPPARSTAQQPALQVEHLAPRPRDPVESPPQETAGRRRSAVIPQPIESAASAPAKPFQPPAPNPTEGFADRTPVLALGSPPALPASPGMTPLGHELYAAATVTYEPIGPSTLQRAFRKIPGLRLLERSPERDSDSFVPPRPRNEISFLAPTTSGRDLLERTPIDLKITVDESGNMSRVQLLPASKNNPAASLAVRASLTWKFAPARWKGKAVASEMIVRLAFGDRSGSAAFPLRVSGAPSTDTGP